MATIEQADFSGGIYRGRKAPPGTVYDAVNALINDEGLLFKRGCATYKTTTDAGVSLTTLIDAFTVGGRRTLASDGSNSAYVVNSDDQTLSLIPFEHWADRRPAAIGGAIYVTRSDGSIVMYGGSRKPGYSTGTITLTNGSAIVTGSGTAWSANLDPGTLISPVPSVGQPAIVQTVDSNTQVTLSEPWQFPTQTGVGYQGLQVYEDLPSEISAYFGSATPNAPIYLAAVGAGPRLIAATRQRIFMSRPGFPMIFDANNYLQLPSNAKIVSLDSFQDAAIVFTTSGIWRLSNLDLDPVDDGGNPQWQQEQINKDIVLWGDLGVTAWRGSFVVPALDDVYLFGVNGSVESLSASIRPLYRAYVKAGRKPGQAVVHRGHYFLPILDGFSNPVDVLVCRLDRNAAWTRWAGLAAGRGFAQRIDDDGKIGLLGITGQRITNLTDCMEATGGFLTQDADATTPTFRVDENDIDLGPGIRPNTVEKVRYVYETTGGTPTITVSYATGPEGSSYSAATLKRGGGASDGRDYSAWRVVEKAERVRFRFECASQVTSLILRRREATIRGADQH